MTHPSLLYLLLGTQPDPCYYTLFHTYTHTLTHTPQLMSLALCGPQSVDELRRLALLFAHITDPSPAEGERADELLPALSQVREAVSFPSSLESKPNPNPEEGQEGHSQTLSQPLEGNPLEGQEAGQEGGSEGFPFVKEALGGLVRLRPSKDVRDLSVMFGMHTTRAEYRKSPTALLSFLLSHKGPGGLFSALQAKGWASGCSASTRTDTEDFSIFQVSVYVCVYSGSLGG